MTWKGEKARHGMSARGISTKNLQAKGYYEDQGKYYEQRVEMWVGKIVELLKRENFGDELTDKQLESIAYGLINTGIMDDVSNLVENGEKAFQNYRVYEDLSYHVLQIGNTLTIGDEKLEIVGIDNRGNIITRIKDSNEMRVVSEEALFEEGYP